MSKYDNIAYIYDILGWYKDSIKIFTRLICHIGTTYKTHLDMACGTGEVAILSKKYCHKVYAFDLSKSMIDIAIKKMGNVYFSIQSLLDFRYPIQFDLITCIYDGYNHLISENDWHTSFQNVYHHLSDSGIFFFDIDTISNISNWAVNEIIQQDKYTIIKNGIYDKKEKKALLSIIVSDKSKDKFHIKFEVKSMPYKKIHDTLIHIGFKTVKLIFRSDKTKDTGQKLYILAYK